MKSTFVITVDIPPTPSQFLRRGLPDGVTMDFEPMTFTRGFDVNVTFNFDIKVTVDLGLVSASAVAAWFVGRFCRPKININPRIDGKTLPPNDADGIKMITDAITDKEQKDTSSGNSNPDA